jgi:hypothetical protein
MYVTLAVYIGIIAAIMFVPKLQPKGLPLDDLHRLVVTLAIWVVLVLGTEIFPMSEAEVSD